MIYWLVMYIFAGTSSSMLHVGNYRNMTVWQQHIEYVPQYACIQANGGGAQTSNSFSAPNLPWPRV
jgi:hypothetical protein